LRGGDIVAQQMVNGSHYDGSVTVTNRMSKDYAVVNPPFEGKYRKPQDFVSLAKRKEHWRLRKMGFDAKLLSRR
jgi:hypothetical protein